MFVIHLFFCLKALVPLEKMIADTIAYTRERKVFGKPVLDNQTVHFTLAELQTELELLRSAVYRAVGKIIYTVG